MPEQLALNFAGRPKWVGLWCPHETDRHAHIADASGRAACGRRGMLWTGLAQAWVRPDLRCPICAVESVAASPKLFCSVRK